MNKIKYIEEMLLCNRGSELSVDDLLLFQKATHAHFAGERPPYRQGSARNYNELRDKAHEASAHALKHNTIETHQAAYDAHDKAENATSYPTSAVHTEHRMAHYSTISALENPDHFTHRRAADAHEALGNYKQAAFHVAANTRFPDPARHARLISDNPNSIDHAEGIARHQAHVDEFSGKRTTAHRREAHKASVRAYSTTGNEHDQINAHREAMRMHEAAYLRHGHDGSASNYNYFANEHHHNAHGEHEHMVARLKRRISSSS